MKLNLNQKERFFGQTLEEYLEKLPNELTVDAVGLWQFVLSGRDGFGLAGEALKEFVRLCLLALLQHGAKPVVGGGDTTYDWLLSREFGQTDVEIANAIVEKWLSSQFKEDDLWELWFALPSDNVGEIV